MKKDVELIKKAAGFAAVKHEGQTYDNGRPFLVHPQQVASVLAKVTDDSNLIAAAWLHDTVEDTDTTYEELMQEFGEDIANLVMEVTHEGERDSVGFYFPRLKTQRGIMLKFADRLSNISHMEGWADTKKQHYLKKSRFWKSEAVEVSNLTDSQADTKPHSELAQTNAYTGKKG